MIKSIVIQISCLLLLIFLIASLGCRNTGIKDIASADELERSIHKVGEFGAPAVWSENFDSSIAQAKKDGKIILANFTGSNWCVYCKKLEAEVFDTSEFQKWASKKFVLLKVDFPNGNTQSPEIKNQNQELKQRYSQYLQGYPTILFLTPTGEVVGKTGYIKGGPEKFIQLVDLQISK